jgi:general secretion pathway protein G
MDQDRRGFTLIEIMIVVIIISALAAMVIPRFSGRTEEARVSIAKADVNSNINTALKMYELDNGDYPTTEQGLAALLVKPTSNPVPPNWNGPYIERKPVDPWKNEYHYKYPGSHSKFDIYSVGRDGVEGTADDIGNW